ncbi:helix-turn-helix transcriptional regulator [Acidithiobacillus ferridurans]|uniref:ArsR/SmtB family transcription factor n=1 Tax=Acidithiobacillus ferridurans TaxID=1232575 RepID=UPI001C068CE7|nr:helix-turn-helix transcriptional regulator [Acidithiobacillus ferridurans]MBU2803968.1 helix-turn-helix transcriptional regulator [Acidithiobacillus ferridurans]
MELPKVVALLGVPARASMAWALVGGDALPASELAYRAGVTPQTASHHLARMVDGGLLAVERCLRYRYYRLASPAVAEILESLMALSGPPILKNRPDRAAVDPLRQARSCYDHLAGNLAVALADTLQRNGWINLQERDYQVTEVGEHGFAAFGLDLPALRHQQRLFARRCIDWSERRPHIGGALGAALMTRFQESGWIRRNPGDRKIWVSSAGQQGLWKTFGIDATR